MRLVFAWSSSMMHRLGYGVLILSLTAMLAVGGCSRQPVDGRPKVVPVSGKVLYKQQPVEGATVVFMPADTKYAAACRSDAGGEFRLRTFETDDGAVPGKYAVTVKKFEFLYPPGGGEIEKQLLPEKYGAATSSGLTATVVEEGKNEFTFELND